MRHTRAVRKPEGHAFTLIELLIVIAIIAILALIAVPNFLEAQTRAKISRVMADQRTISVAVEAYAVDWGRVPIGWRECIKWSPVFMGIANDGDNRSASIYSRMTTPVSFISSIPINPFADHPTIGKTGNMNQTRSYIYHSVSAQTAQGVDMGAPYEDAAAVGVTFLLYSKGPSRRYSVDPSQGADSIRAGARIESANAYPDLIYDASNGTLSFGYMIRTNLGGLQ